jgi:hypothetical protein
VTLSASASAASSLLQIIAGLVGSESLCVDEYFLEPVFSFHGLDVVRKARKKQTKVDSGCKHIVWMLSYSCCMLGPAHEAFFIRREGL